MHLSEKVTKFQSNKNMSQDITNLRNENPEIRKGKWIHKWFFFSSMTFKCLNIE